MEGVLYNGRGSAHTACPEDVLDGWEGDPYDVFSCPHYALQGLAFECFTIPKPHSDTVGQDVLHSSSVEDGEDGWWEPGYLQSPPEVQALLCLLHYSAGVDGPGEVVRNVHTKKLGASDSLHLRATDERGEVVGLPSAEVNNHLLCFIHIKR